MLTRKLRRDDRGMTLVFAGLGFSAFFAASILAVDVGMLMTARNQAQNAADAGALAGAVALAFDDFDDRSANGAAVQNAIAAATAQGNQVMHEAVSITPDDVAFVNDSSGQPNWVRVSVFRADGRGNPISTLIGSLIGTPWADIAATATAETLPANAAMCVMPFAMPDKWVDHTGPSNCFEAYNRGGSRRSRADLYVPPSPTEVGTGYVPGLDTGTQLRLDLHPDGDTAQAFKFLPIRLPGTSGAQGCTDNIINCNRSVLEIGDLMTFEDGNVVPAIVRGVEDRIAQDPTAYWDTTRNRVVSPMSPSPRIVTVPLFNPDYYDLGRNSGRDHDLKVGNIAGFFLERTEGDRIVGRLMSTTALVRGEPALGGFVRSIRLVR